VFDPQLAAPVNESRLYGSDGVLGAGALHMAAVSRYGCITRCTRASSRARLLTLVPPGGVRRVDRASASFWTLRKARFTASLPRPPPSSACAG
jgi:hypothetical protein